MGILSDRLRYVIETSGKSNRYWADKCDISARSFMRYVNNESEPSIDSLIKICNGLNIDPNYLLGYSDAPLSWSRDISVGCIVKHFKREFIDLRTDPNAYLYKIIDIGIDCESSESVVVYSALYGNYSTFTRPYSEFISEVDHDKYPTVKQKYRFEIYNP